MTRNQVALDTLNHDKQVIVGSKVNRVPEVRKENWVVPNASGLVFALALPSPVS